MGAQKAYFGAAASALVALLSALSGALGEGATFADIDTQTWLNAVLAAIVATGVTGGTVYGVKNKVNQPAFGNSQPMESEGEAPPRKDESKEIPPVEDLWS